MILNISRKGAGQRCSSRLLLISASRLFIPTIFLYHMGEFYNELSLLVFLATFVSMFILPAKCGLTAIAVDVCHRVKPSQEDPLLRWTNPHVDHGVEEVSPALTTLEWFADQLIMIGELGPTVNTGICAVAIWQVSPECLHSSGMSRGGPGSWCHWGGDGATRSQRGLGWLKTPLGWPWALFQLLQKFCTILVSKPGGL